uniref:NADH dehydrogenase subunit 4L n=1 Tax=Tigriopus californicus TaxID=6832 RepID=A2T4Y9_TIGCA|nr:NADH dehydrogenase subunit 4L [Tigriopus californicus]ABI33101.1 NADH dehydrogenase subunit 4L [Tigriopus californicus]
MGFWGLCGFLGLSKIWNPWVLFGVIWFKFSIGGKNLLILLLVLELVMVLSFIAGSFSVVHSQVNLMVSVYLSVMMVGESLLALGMLIKFSRSYSKEIYSI